MKEKSRVRLYSSPTCPHCRKAKGYLRENGIKFLEFNVLEDQAARDEMVKASGQMGVPVIVVNGKTIVGFNEEAFKESLGI